MERGDSAVCWWAFCLGALWCQAESLERVEGTTVRARGGVGKASRRRSNKEMGRPPEGWALPSDLLAPV